MSGFNKMGIPQNFPYYIEEFRKRKELGKWAKRKNLVC